MEEGGWGVKVTKNTKILVKEIKAICLRSRKGMEEGGWGESDKEYQNISKRDQRYMPEI